jgi:hypothetical protein
MLRFPGAAILLMMHHEKSMDATSPTRRRVIGICCAVALSGGFIGSAVTAQAQDAPTPNGACFDVARPPGGEAAGAILVNRCTGRTWILVGGRKRHGDQVAYRWMPIVTADAAPAAPAPAPSPPRVHAPASPNSDKCFTYQGRKFCE